MLRKFLTLDNWSRLVVIYLWSSSFIGKASVYVGLALGGLLIFSTRVFWNRWYLALTRSNDPVNRFAWALLVSLLYGIAQVIRGVLLGYEPMIALQILVFNLCPVYLFLGLWVGFRHPGIIRKYIRFLAWLAVIYTPLYFIFFQNLHISLNGIVPGSGLDLLSSPGSGSFVLLGLLTLETSLAQFWLPIVVLVCLTIGYQERADWVSLGLSLVVWGKVTSRIGRVVGIAGCIFAVLLFAALIDLKLPPFPGRGGELSARGTIARMAGSFSKDMASEVGADAATARFEYGTVYWRKHWWAAIRNEVSQDYKTEIFGLGYGYPLAKLASRDVEKEGTRSPHSIFYFTVAYSGGLGFAIFCWLEICLILLLWRTYKLTGATFGLIYLVYTLCGAFFGNLIETPQASIPLYLLCGMAMGPVFLRIDQVYEVEHSVPAPEAQMV
ncbi:MAG: hypothetical protein WCD57_23245 [Acidobacteriaceae bacterium]